MVEADPPVVDASGPRGETLCVAKIGKTFTFEVKVLFMVHVLITPSAERLQEPGTIKMDGEELDPILTLPK